MKYYAQSILNHIQKQVEKYLSQDGICGKLIITMPSVPAQVAQLIGSRLLEYQIRNRSVVPLVKISSNLMRDWQKSDNLKVRNSCKSILENGWDDQQGNLTAYRNRPAGKDHLLLIVLIGIDRIADSSSLEEFHRCDTNTIWRDEMQESFAHWCEQALKESHIGYERDTLDHFDIVFQALRARGLAGMVELSCFLEKLVHDSLPNVQDGKGAEDCLLNSLAEFNLPSFASYRFSSRRDFRSYLEDAVDFFSYDQFLDERNRTQAVRRIEKYIEQKAPEETKDESYFRPFSDCGELAGGLINYIKSNSGSVHDQLMQSDFVFIRDEILKFRPRKEQKAPKTTIKRLTGSPIDVVLSALWSTLKEFKELAFEHNSLANEILQAINIEAQLFKHDITEGSRQEEEVAARFCLARLLGGVDQLIAEWMDMQKLCGNTSSSKCISRLLNDNIQYQPSRTAEPSLQFSITLQADGWDRPFVKLFAWRLPETEHYRVADELLQLAFEHISVEKDYCLPIFHVPYYNELMQAKDDEETCRVLLQCIKDESNSVINLLSAEDMPRDDHFLTYLEKLAYNYNRFIKKASSSGLHLALESTEWQNLRQSYVLASKAYITTPEFEESHLAKLLFRSFLIVHRRPEKEGLNWVWDDHEQSAIVTILHPALLEMVHARIHYLFTSFLAIASQELKFPGAKHSFRDGLWQNYIDLAAIQMPLCGLIKDRDKILDTNIRGENLIHRIGSVDDDDSPLTTRLMLRYDAQDDEDISDSELFRDSRESTLIFNILNDYRELHPHATDGLSIAVYQNHSIQPIISAVDHFLEEVFKTRPSDAAKFTMSVTVFTDSNDEAGISRWIINWKERWEMAETQESLARYRNSRLSVAHRIVSSKDDYAQFQRLIHDGLEIDIAILNRFIGAGVKGNDFDAVEQYDITTRRLKFPILEKSFCASSGPGERLQRSRVLSNRQFSISAQHTELMARIKAHRAKDESFVILGFGDYRPWQGVIDAFHSRAEWVVCIDPNVDDRLISSKGKAAENEREIIGFGSGVGSHGEANFTVSTEQFSLADISNGLKLAASDVYSGWQKDDYVALVNEIIAESRMLSGLSLVRATGRSQYIRDFMAYALTRKLLKSEPNVLCDQLISLDAYRHWFDSAENGSRPDLLWITALFEADGRLHLNMRLVECKMAKMAEEYLDKARQQLENGLLHLVSIFKPKLGVDTGEDERPDQRYWWLQLHRLIASKAEITPKNPKKKILTALERLSDGDFSISWRAAAITFWTDQSSGDIVLSDNWPFTFDDQRTNICVYSAGNEFVRNLSNKGGGSIEWDVNELRFTAETKATDKNISPDEEEQAGGSGDNGPKKPGGPTSSSGGLGTQVPEKADETPMQPHVSVPERILLGETTAGSRKVYWEFGHPDLNNRHMIIFGSSGMGKTYTIQCLLAELGRCGQNSLIVDYTDGFSDKQLEKGFKAQLHPLQHIVRKEPLSINPFRRQSDVADGEESIEDITSTAQRVSGVFSQVYELGDQQKSALYQSVKNAFGTTEGSKIGMQEVISELETMREEKGSIGLSAASVISKIIPFVDQNPFGTEDPLSWEKWFKDTEHRCHVLQLAGFHKDSSRLITEFSLIDLYWFYRGRGSKDSPKVIVMDEIQNLDHRDDSPLAQLLTEGRKFGFSLILATQIMSNLEKDEKDRLFNAGHKLFFKPTDTEVRTYAEIAAIATGEKMDQWMIKLASLTKSECYSIGPSLNTGTGKLEAKAFRIKITSLDQRISTWQ